MEDFVGQLNDRAHFAVLETHRDFDAVPSSRAVFDHVPGDSAGDRTEHRGDRAAPPASHPAAGNAADHRAGDRSDAALRPVVGGVAGGGMGGGRGSVVTAVLGAVAGGVAGHVIEDSATRRNGVEITVRLENGEMRAIVQLADEVFHPGERVRILSSGGSSRVTH